MIINDYGLEKEVINEALATIENNTATQDFLRKVLVKPTNMFTRLSPRMVRNIEDDTGVKIEQTQLEIEKDTGKKKKQTLIAFFALHPWLAVNSQKPGESITEWLNMYKELANGKSVVIRSNGTIELE